MANGIFPSGDGTTINPYIIEDAYDFDKIREKPEANYSIVKNIDLMNICSKNGSEGWIPIENFSGILEGNGHLVKNMIINRTTADYQGLFKSLQGGAIINLGLTNVAITGKDYVGAFVGNMSTNEDLIENCFVTGSIIGNNYVGGLVGDMTGGTIINSYSEATLSTVSSCGGIAGNMNNVNAIIKNCYAASTCSSNNTALIGGITGARAAGNVINTFYDSTLNFNTSAGAGGFTTQDMQDKGNFTAWTDQYYSFEKPVWIFKDNAYPKLYYTEDTKYVIFVNNKYMTYKDNAWSTISTEFPNEDSFDTHGMTDQELQEIPKYKWNELRQYKTFDVIASTEKFAIERKTVRTKMEVDSQYASCVVLKANLNLNEIGDSINRIRIVH